MKLFYDKEGNPIEDFMEYAKLCEDETYRYIKQETLPNGVYLSTIWVGLDMSIDGSKLIFETMAFVDGTPEGVGRVATLEEALETHERAVKEYS